MVIQVESNESAIVYCHTMGIQRGYDGDMVNKYRYGMCIYIYIVYMYTHIITKNIDVLGCLKMMQTLYPQIGR